MKQTERKYYLLAIAGFLAAVFNVFVFRINPAIEGIGLFLMFFSVAKITKKYKELLFWSVIVLPVATILDVSPLSGFTGLFDLKASFLANFIYATLFVWVGIFFASVLNKHKKVKFKGITPVIALVMLMLITVGLVGTAYVWFSGMLTTYTEKTISVSPGGAFCSNSKISVVVTNTGATSSITQADLTTFVVDDYSLTIGDAARPVFVASAGEGKMALQNYNCGTTCASGLHIIIIGTRANTIETSARCK